MLAKDFSTSHESHEYVMQADSSFECSRCNHNVLKTGSGGVCIGIPIYTKWHNIPDSLATKTTLNKEHNKKPSKTQQPVACKKKYDRKGKSTGHYYPLYLIEDAIPKKAPTDAQKKALEKARYMGEKLTVKCSECGEHQMGRYDWVTVTRKTWIAEDYDNYVCFICKDRKKATEWANELLQDGNAVILDTETTDLDGEIIEIAVMSVTGETILNKRIKPVGKMSRGAYEAHGISLEDLENEASFKVVYPLIMEAIQGKRVIIYNADFDNGILSGDVRMHELEQIEYDSECAMEMYAQFFGDWSEHWQSYKWVKLYGDHSALGDCKATLERIKSMATGEIEYSI